MKRPKFHNAMTLIGGFALISMISSATYFIFYMAFTDFEISLPAVKVLMLSVWITVICYILDNIYS